jgi:hypothetical protein
LCSKSVLLVIEGKSKSIGSGVPKTNYKYTFKSSIVGDFNKNKNKYI